MNAYTKRGQAQIQQRDIANIVRSDWPLTGPSLAALERHRGDLAKVELDWLLKQHGSTSQAGASLVARLRQTIGAVLVRAGQRLAGVPCGGVLPEPAAAAGPLGTGG